MGTKDCLRTYFFDWGRRTGYNFRILGGILTNLGNQLCFLPSLHTTTNFSQETTNSTVNLCCYTRQQLQEHRLQLMSSRLLSLFGSGRQDVISWSARGDQRGAWVLGGVLTQTGMALCHPFTDGTTPTSRLAVHFSAVKFKKQLPPFD